MVSLSNHEQPFDKLRANGEKYKNFINTYLTMKTRVFAPGCRPDDIEFILICKGDNQESSSYADGKNSSCLSPIPVVPQRWRMYLSNFQVQEDV